MLRNTNQKSEINLKNRKHIKIIIILKSIFLKHPNQRKNIFVLTFKKNFSIMYAMKLMFGKFLKDINLSNLGRIITFSVLVGIIAGLGAITLYVLIQFFTHYVLVKLAGYTFAKTYGEASIFKSESAGHFKRWMLLFLPAIGGIFSGFLVFKFAPEAEGHGTDSVIDTIHRKNGRFKWQIPIIKAVASGITIGTGGSGGREGPIAQIGAAMSAILAKTLKLSDREIRIAACCGMGAGIGAIFKSPLAGAIFGIEVLYRTSDMEYEALVPCIISAIVSYSVFSIFFGFKPLFLTYKLTFTNPTDLFFYALLGIICSVFGWMYVKSFYATRDFFKNLKISNYLKPPLGGLLTGIICFFIPQMLSTDYGQVQLMLTSTEQFTLLTLFLFIILKIFATSFSIGSGGSGGVFGPAIFAGAAVGTFSGKLFQSLFPDYMIQTGSFTVVGMAGFFAGIAHTPISTLIMVSELTGNYGLLVPTMFVCAITFVLNRNVTIYEKQVYSRIDSPAHKKEFQFSILEDIKISEVMVKEVRTIPENMPFKKIKEFIPSTPYTNFPVVDKEGNLVGIISFNKIKDVVFEESLENIVVARELIEEHLVTLTPDKNLLDAINAFGTTEAEMIPIIDKKDFRKMVGILTRHDVMKAHRHSIQKYFEELKKAKETIF